MDLNIDRTRQPTQDRDNQKQAVELMVRGDGGLGTIDHVLKYVQELLERDRSLDGWNLFRKSGDHCILGNGLMTTYYWKTLFL